MHFLYYDIHDHACELHHVTDEAITQVWSLCEHTVLPRITAREFISFQQFGY